MTPAQAMVAALVSDPFWDFEHEPARLIGHATVRAATAHRDRRPVDARFWTEAAVALVAASPGMERGAVLDGLVETYKP